MNEASSIPLVLFGDYILLFLLIINCYFSKYFNFEVITF